MKILLLYLAVCTAEFVLHKGHDIIVDPQWEQPALPTFYDHLLIDATRKPIYLYTLFHVPQSFDGTYILYCGESIDPTGWHGRASQTLFLGHSTNSLARHTIWLPLASLIFSFYQNRSPLDLLIRPMITTRPYFAVYIASNCVPYRERLYDELVHISRTYNLGEVHAYGKCCGSYPDTRRQSVHRFDSDVFNRNIETMQQYRYVLACENINTTPEYVTEKLTIALLSGAIPIYSGGSWAHKLYNNATFIWVAPNQQLVDVLLPVALNPTETLAKLTAPLVIDLYPFSWHRDIQALFRTQGRRTLKDDIYDKLGSKMEL